MEKHENTARAKRKERRIYLANEIAHSSVHKFVRELAELIGKDFVYNLKY